MTTVKVHRLELLACFLDYLPPENFNINIITDVVRCLRNCIPQVECGSVCCAIGWTPHLFPELVSYQWQGGMLKPHTKSGKYLFQEVAMELFGIGFLQAGELFSYRGDNGTPAALAAKIRRFCAKHQDTDNRTFVVSEAS